METITITVTGEESESMNLKLSAEEVTALHKLRKANSVEISELEKKVSELEKSKKYAEENLLSARDEIQQANTLLTALGIAEKSNEEEAYYRTALSITTRIALYIAAKT